MALCPHPGGALRRRLAAAARLAADDPAAGASASAAAGLSLGEYCALVHAGALSFEDGLQARLPWRSVIVSKASVLGADGGRKMHVAAVMHCAPRKAT